MPTGDPLRLLATGRFQHNRFDPQSLLQVPAAVGQNDAGQKLILAQSAARVGGDFWWLPLTGDFAPGTTMQVGTLYHGGSARPAVRVIDHDGKAERRAFLSVETNDQRDSLLQLLGQPVSAPVVTEANR